LEAVDEDEGIQQVGWRPDGIQTRKAA